MWPLTALRYRGGWRCDTSRPVHRKISLFQSRFYKDTRLLPYFQHIYLKTLSALSVLPLSGCLSWLDHKTGGQPSFSAAEQNQVTTAVSALSRDQRVCSIKIVPALVPAHKLFIYIEFKRKRQRMWVECAATTFSQASFKDSSISQRRAFLQNA